MYKPPPPWAFRWFQWSTLAWKKLEVWGLRASHVKKQDKILSDTEKTKLLYQARPVFSVSTWRCLCYQVQESTQAQYNLEGNLSKSFTIWTNKSLVSIHSYNNTHLEESIQVCGANVVPFHTLKCHWRNLCVFPDSYQYPLELLVYSWRTW